MKLNLQVAEDYPELSRIAARIVEVELKRNPNLLLCASAGSTPTGMYEFLAKTFERNPHLFSRMRVLQIDEWGGLPERHAAACETDLQRKLLRPLGIKAGRYAGFKSGAPKPQEECERIANWLAVNGPIDICILGLGLNGHIAMNEPAQELMPHAHVARIARSSRQHGMLKGLRKKPRYGLTLGMAEIFTSRKALLLVSGSSKRDILKKLLEPKVTTRLPASFLWLHPDMVVLCDKEARGARNPAE
jgi:putative deaminase/isomerase